MSEVEVVAEHEYIVLTDNAMSAILGHCLTNPGFLRNCASCLPKKHIKNIMISDLYGQVIDWYKKYQRAPTHHELEGNLIKQHSDQPTLNKYRNILEASYTKHALNFGIDALQVDISGWLKTVILFKVLDSVQGDFKRGRYQEIEVKVKKLIGELRDASFTKDDRIDTTNMEDVINNIIVSRDNACTLGHPDFDELIMEGSKILPSDTVRYNADTLIGQTRGCLLAGEHTVLIGPSNAGKTTAVATIVGCNIAFGKKVLLITCEDPAQKILLKLMQSFHGLHINDIKHTNTDSFRKYNDEWKDQSVKLLHYYEYMKPGKMFIEDVLDIVENAQEKELILHGKGFGMVMIDYPGVLGSSAFDRGREQYLEQEYVYHQAGLCARKHGFHMFTPAQTNREGFKANRESEHLLDMDSIASGFSIVKNADNVITINRNASDHNMFRVKFYIAKTRSGANKRLFISETRYDLGRTHGIGYGHLAWETDKLKLFNDDGAIEQDLGSKRRHTQAFLQQRDNTKVAYSVSSKNMPPPSKNQLRDIPALKPWSEMIVTKPNEFKTE